MPSKKSEIKAHSDWSASASQRWLNCPGSVRLNRLAPKQPDSAAALEGTAAHALAEVCLKKNLNPKQVRASLIEDKKLQPLVNKEMREHVAKYIEYVKGFRTEASELLIEEKSDLAWVWPGMFATNDAVVIEPWGDIHVFDLKYGRKRVVTENNTQLLIYALAAAKRAEWDFDRVHLHVYQPRLTGQPEASWSLTAKELEPWVERFKIGAEATTHTKAPLVPGDWCHFCPSSATCPALKKEAEEKAVAVFDDGQSFAPVSPDQLTTKQIAAVLDKADVFYKWIEDVQAHAFRVMNGGGHIPGFKLVEKKGVRTWASKYVEAKAKKLFGNNVYETKFKSPAQLEKVSKKAKEFVNKNTVKVSSGLRIAKESDARPETSRVEWEFGDD